MTATGPRLEEITPGNLDAALGIRVRPDQEHAVAPVVKSLAEAYVHPGVAWPRLIVDGDRPVGFLLARWSAASSRIWAAQKAVEQVQPWARTTAGAPSGPWTSTCSRAPSAETAVSSRTGTGGA
ncbi:hypothetical protein AB0L17_36285 [Streptomyces cellulosae]